ncbi:MAG: hypothetical protein WKF84_00960 [Pyrinomonadaceae bacterium]
MHFNFVRAGEALQQADQLLVAQSGAKFDFHTAEARITGSMDHEWSLLSYGWVDEGDF